MDPPPVRQIKKIPPQVCGSTTTHIMPTPTTAQCPTCTYARAGAHVQCDMCGFNPTHTPTTLPNIQTSNLVSHTPLLSHSHKAPHHQPTPPPTPLQQSPLTHSPPHPSSPSPPHKQQKRNTTTSPLPFSS